MSLLIKALDHLDKNKQAEKDKKQAGDYVADEALMLELMPVEPKTELNLTVESLQGIAETNNPAITVEDGMLKKNVLDRELSLEEEAGLTDALITPRQYKSKPVATKDPDKAAKPALDTTKVALESTKPAKKPEEKIAPVFQSVAMEQNQQAAAKVFVANKTVKAPTSKFALVILAVVGAILIWLGLQGYSYIKVLMMPELVVVKSSSPIQQPQPAQITESTLANLPTEVVTPNNETQAAPVAEASDDNTNVASKGSASALDNQVPAKSNIAEDTIATEPKKASRKNTSASNEDKSISGDVIYKPESSTKGKRKPLNLISRVSESSIDPILMGAYQAYTRGDDALAQQQYRQVLQRDVRNVDALLGMAAIAQRQGRDADALGWYQKVLEIEPANTIAQSASISPSANADPVTVESHIKNMLARQPDAANLHASLGNLYAEQNQWPSAQEAYFNASRLAPNNADYAFNLAISLDQMGKAKLALKQYERALELVNQSGSASPNKAALEARIHELQ